MPFITVQQAFEVAVQHHKANRLAEAEMLYRQVLSVEPNHTAAFHFLGVLAHQSGRDALAEKSIRHAIFLDSKNSDAFCDLGEVYRKTGRAEEAIACFHQAIQLKPDHALAFYNLAVVLCDTGRLEEGIAAYRSVLRSNPNSVEAYNNLGAALASRGELGAAIDAYRRAVDLFPNLPQAYNNLGNALRNLGRLDEAISAFRRALEIEPNRSEIHSNLGNVLREKGDLDEAIGACTRAIDIDSNNPKAYLNLGNVLKDAGMLTEAIDVFRQALRLQPSNPGFHSNVLFTLYYLPNADGVDILEEQRRWDKLAAKSWQPVVGRYSNERAPERPLRIGYVSPDFRDHVVGRNLLPLFRHHNHEDFEIFCYSDVVRPDLVTGRFHESTGQWRVTVGATDAVVVEMIQKDKIDVLVDLSQHTSGNRLPVFARRPAPIQLSFAGYPESTGLTAIEYRISDRWLESDLENRSAEFAPEHKIDHLTKVGDPQSAEIVSLIDSFWCYDPCGVEVDLQESGAKTGCVTFGSLANFCKINEPLMQLWARVLARVTGSRLILLSALGSHRQRTLNFMAQEGIKPDRVEFVAPCPRKDYLKLYHRIDIMLDTFPYNGHTTSLDALWMGVPVVSLAGERPVSRAGLSILNNLGLPELVTFEEDEYVEIAVNLANDLPRLAELRRTLRSRMESSVLMNGPHFAQQIEAAYRAMWWEWCAKQESSA